MFGINFDINVGRSALERNFYVNIGRAECEAYSLNLGTNSAFALRPKKSTENLDRVGRSQKLPDKK
jgi:hypothetical protein